MRTLLLLFLGFAFIINSQAQVAFNDTHIILDYKYSTQSPTSVKYADVDGDSIMDVIFSSGGDDKVGWYRGIGSGEFEAQRLIAYVHGARSICVADLDNDGDPDILSASNTNKLFLHENMGSGLFASKTVIDDLQSVNSISAVDLDNDGKLDILASSSLEHLVCWYKNLGYGNFDVRNVVGNPQTPTSILVFDLDGDGDLDVCTNDNYYWERELVWYENSGFGIFASKQIIETGTDYNSVASLDVDLDGDLDILGCAYSDKRVYLYENLGGGNFGPKTIACYTSNAPLYVSTSDLDGDGYEDVIVTSYSEPVEWFKNLGFNNFSSKQYILSSSLGRGSVLAADVDMDGHQDLIIAGNSSSSIAWHKNSSATFEEKHLLTRAIHRVKDVLAYDLDNDGDLDVLSSSNRDNKLAWYPNDGLGEFEEQRIIGNEIYDLENAIALDADADGDLDIVARGYFSTVYHENLGAGNFGSAQFISLPSYVSDLQAADLDGDGDDDLVVSFSSPGSISWFESNGDGTFGIEELIADDIYEVQRFSLTDLDLDGDQDILMANSTSDVYWFENMGGGVISSKIEILHLGGANPQDAFAADLDGDGDQDVLVAISRYGPGNNEMVWLENLGSTTFGPEIFLNKNAYNATVIKAADFDGDGDLEIICDDGPSPFSAVWYDNNGAAEFSSKQVISATQFKAIADFNGDGKPDLLMVNEDGSGIYWLENGLFITYNPTEITVLENDVTRFHDVAYSPLHNGYFLSGTEDEGVTFRVDYRNLDGELIWNARIQSGVSETSNIANAAIVRPNGNVLAIGTITTPSQGVIMSLDGFTGDENFTTILGGPGDDELVSLCATSDGGAIACGMQTVGSQEDGWMIKLDAAENIIWEQTLNAGNDERINDVVENDGSYYAIGRSRIAGITGSYNQGIVARLDTDGNLLWKKLELDSTVWFDAELAPGDGFVVVGSKRTSTDKDLIAAHYNSAGNIEWTTNITLPGSVDFAGSIIAYQGAYLIAGRKNNDSLAWVIQLNTDGVVVADYTFEFTAGGRNVFSDMELISPDGTLAFSGLSGPFTNHNGLLTTMRLPCPSPVVSNVIPGPTGAQISWLDNPRHLTHNILGRKLGTIPFQSGFPASNPVLLNSLLPSTSYEWKIKAKCSDNQISDFTTLDTFTTTVLREEIKSNEIEKQLILELSPNPTSEILHIRTSGLVTITGNDGKLYWSAEIEKSASIKVAHFPTGTYQVNVATQSEIFSTSFIKH